MDEKDIQKALDELFDYVESNTSKSFTHQIIRGNNLTQEFKLTRRGFEFYAGYNKNVLQCQFDKNTIMKYDITNSSISEALEYLKKVIRDYMCSKSIWKY